MNRILIFSLILQSCFLFGQKVWKDCTLQYELNTTDLQENGIINFSLTNTGNKKIRINKSFWPYRMQLIEITETSLNEGTKIGYTADVDCFKDCIKETVKLKPGYIYTYNIDIKETIQYQKLLNGRTYKFKLWFDMIDVTNEECVKRDFTSEEIIYKK